MVPTCPLTTMKMLPMLAPLYLSAYNNLCHKVKFTSTTLTGHMAHPPLVISQSELGAKLPIVTQLFFPLFLLIGGATSQFFWHSDWLSWFHSI